MSAFRDAVAAATQDTPYRVIDTKKGFDVQLDVDNAQWWGLFHHTGLTSTFRWRVVEHASYFTITDRKVRLKFAAGVPRFAFSWEMQSGRIPAFTREKIWTLTDRGRIEAVGNYRFNSREGRDLIRLVAQRLGLKERQPWSVKLAVAAVLATPIGFAIYGLVLLAINIFT
ncbi:hypothetical protein [Mycolicibacterium wolinskyi]|uniref:hypothetical protein n=1 Tax=Mycolicibacterium wolinskyi TaxID=59750 RepID=UPI00391776EB